jgi:ABC-type phosphate transport system substrate-binding protein
MKWSAPRSSRWPLATAVLLSLTLAARPARLGAQLAVVVNTTNAVDELSADALRRLFLGQVTTFPTGSRARLATHTGSTETFSREALGLQREVVRSRWMAMTFRGEATSIPSDYASPDDVKRFVREHADAIAYLPLADVDASVKVLRIEGRRPTDSSYLLR